MLQDLVGTEMSYQCAVNSPYNFGGVKNLLLTDIDTQWLREYEKYNLAKGNKCNVYMRSLKTLFGRAVERGYIEPAEMPFKTKYQPRGYCFAHLSKVTSKKKLTKRILSIEEMSFIQKYKPTSPALERAHDIFLFSYYNMGVDLKDIALLQMKDIRNVLWYHRRQKSGVAVNGKPLTGAAIDIIHRTLTAKTSISSMTSWETNNEFLKKPSNSGYVISALTFPDGTERFPLKLDWMDTSPLTLPDTPRPRSASNLVVTLMSRYFV